MDGNNTIYIYQDTAVTKTVVKKLTEINKRLKKINHGLTALTLLTAVCFTVMNIRCEMQRAQINKMSEDIEEPTEVKGE